MHRIVITGVSRGIGRELAVQSAAQSHQVFGTVREGIDGDIDGVTIISGVELTNQASIDALCSRVGQPVDLLINNERLLASYDDYRFRAPHMIAVQSNVEFALWGPIGVFAGVEVGKVAERRSDLGFDDLRASGTVGLTLRAGNFPLVNLSFSWGGEGHHVIGEMSSTLLGGGARPSLF